MQPSAPQCVVACNGAGVQSVLHDSGAPHTHNCSLILCGSTDAPDDSQAIAVGQRAMRGKHPQAFMEELGFGPLDLVDSFSVSMAGG